VKELDFEQTAPTTAAQFFGRPIVVTDPKFEEFFAAFRSHKATGLEADSKGITGVAFQKVEIRYSIRRQLVGAQTRYPWF
jgi:hypothetical protein